VTLVLQGADGGLLGALEPFVVEPPWWSEVAAVVEAARREHEVDVTVLRLVAATPDPDDPWQMAGSTTYAAELHGRVPPHLRSDLREVDETTSAAVLDDDPLRLPWARPGGPAAELAWAADALAVRGHEIVGRPQQIRTWNLSSIWSIPTTTGTFWLKSVPPFFAHEGAVIEWLASPDLPPLIAATSGRMLMAEIPGVDHYSAPFATLERAVVKLVAIQHRVARRVDGLFSLGLADWRWPALRALVDDVVERHQEELDRPERHALDELIEGFGHRCDAIDACGLPMTLVHGDFHRGNLRGLGEQLVILDWGDCGVGHPMLDVAAMKEPLDAQSRDGVVEAWAGAWQERYPGSDPLRAATLIEPIAALRQAVIYRKFLDGIEPSERCYHQSDPQRWLRRAARFRGGG
jgi:Phosphotransferase enzyme family